MTDVTPGPARASPPREFGKRFALAHFMAYPLTSVAAVATMPLALMLREDALLRAGARGASNGVVQRVALDLGLGALEAAQLEVVLSAVLWISLAVFVTFHLVALPWALAATRAPDGGRAFRRYVRSTLATLAVLLLGGAVGWLWLWTL